MLRGRTNFWTNRRRSSLLIVWSPPPTYYYEERGVSERESEDVDRMNLIVSYHIYQLFSLHYTKGLVFLSWLRLFYARVFWTRFWKEEKGEKQYEQWMSSWILWSSIWVAVSCAVLLYSTEYTILHAQNQFIYLFLF